jgi:DNA-binding GntR family transcriptional regulator
VEKTLKPLAITPEEAAHLKLQPGGAIFRSPRIARVAGAMVEVGNDLIRGRVYRVTTHCRVRAACQ